MTIHPSRSDLDTVTTPVSWAQERSWSRARAGAPMLHRTLTLSGAGPLNLDVVARAWEALLHRHDVLRTTLTEVHGGPAQVIEPVGNCVRDLRNTGGGPGTDPPATLEAVERGDDRHTLVLRLHDTIADDRSVTVLLRELGRAYGAVLDGTPLDLAFPAPAPRYARQAQLQRRWEATRECLRLRRWWAASPHSSGDCLLPADRGRPPVPSPMFGSVPFDWSGTFDTMLPAQADRASSSTLVLTALHVLLGRYSGSENVVVHLPVEGRPPHDHTEMIGRVDDVLPVHVMTAAAPSFRVLTRRVDEACHEVRLHGALPSQMLPESVSRAPDRFVFVPERGPEHCLELGGTTLWSRSGVDDLAPEVSATADLALVLDPGRRFRGSLFHRSDRFDGSSAERVLAQLRHLLASALSAPDAPLSSLLLEPPEHTVARLRATDRTTEVLTSPTPVHQAIATRVREHPGAPAVVQAGRTLTYEELACEASTVRAALTDAGPVTGTPVVVRAPSGPRQVAAVLGVLEADAHVVCLTRHDMGRHGVQLLEGLRPSRLLLGSGVEDDAGTRLLRDDPNVEVVDLDGPAPERDPPFARECRPHRPMVDGDATAYVAYTSGSSGTPKGIPQSHAALSQFSAWLAREFRLGPGSRVAQWALPGYDAALCETFAALCSGATLYPVPEELRTHPEGVARWLALEGITLFQTVPSFARALSSALTHRAPTDPPLRLESLLLAGEALDGALVTGLRKALPHSRIVNLYGATETILSTYHEVTGEVHGAIPIGSPIPGRQVAVLDEQDRPCPDGVVGRLVVRSPYVTPGYLGVDEGSAVFGSVEALAEDARPGDRYHRTGDLALRRWDGSLEYRGREDDQVKVGGVRFEPGELENALAESPSVRECAVLPLREVDGSSTRLIAYIIPKTPPGPEGVSREEKRAWRSALRLRFGHRTPPITFEVLAVMPRNLGGKVDRRALDNRRRTSVPDKDESMRGTT